MYAAELMNMVLRFVANEVISDQLASVSISGICKSLPYSSYVFKFNRDKASWVFALEVHRRFSGAARGYLDRPKGDVEIARPILDLTSAFFNRYVETGFSDDHLERQFEFTENLLALSRRYRVASTTSRSKEMLTSLCRKLHYRPEYLYRLRSMNVETPEISRSYHPREPEL